MNVVTIHIEKESGAYIGKINVVGKTAISSQPFEDLETALKATGALLHRVAEEISVIVTVADMLMQLEAKDEVEKFIAKLKENKDAN